VIGLCPGPARAAPSSPALLYRVQLHPSELPPGFSFGSEDPLTTNAQAAAAEALPIKTLDAMGRIEALDIHYATNHLEPYCCLGTSVTMWKSPADARRGYMFKVALYYHLYGRGNKRSLAVSHDGRLAVQLFTCACQPTLEVIEARSYGSIFDVMVDLRFRPGAARLTSAVTLAVRDVRILARRASCQCTR
jgi:hypothetical protein